MCIPVEVPQTKELSGLLLTNLMVGLSQDPEVIIKSVSNCITSFTVADSLSTNHQLIDVRVSTSHHHSTIHLGWVQCPVGDPNKCNSLLPCHNLHKCR